MSSNKDSVFYTPPTFEFEGTTYRLGRLRTGMILDIAAIVEKHQETLTKVVSKRSLAEELEKLAKEDAKSRRPKLGLDFLKENAELVGEVGVDLFNVLTMTSREFIDLIAGIIENTDTGETMTRESFLEMPMPFTPLVISHLVQHPDIEVFLGNLSATLSVFGVNISGLMNAAKTPTKLENASA